MPEILHTELSDEMIDFLGTQPISFVTTWTEDEAYPYVAAVTWLSVRDGRTLRLGIDPRSRSVANLRQNARVLVTLTGPEHCYVVEGVARIGSEQLPGVTIKMVLVEITVERVRDAMFYGGKLTSPLAYEKTYDPKLAEKLDREVFDALRTVDFG